MKPLCDDYLCLDVYRAHWTSWREDISSRIEEGVRFGLEKGASAFGQVELQRPSLVGAHFEWETHERVQ